MSWGFGMLASLAWDRGEIDWVASTYLVHKPEDNLLVAHEAASKLAPKFTELLGGCRGRVRGVADDASGHGLLRWVVVSHVVVGVQNAVGALGDGDVVHGVLDLGEVLWGRSAQRIRLLLNGETYSLAERGTEASLYGAQTLEQEGNAEQEGKSKRTR